MDSSVAVFACTDTFVIVGEGIDVHSRISHHPRELTTAPGHGIAVVGCWVTHGVIGVCDQLGSRLIIYRNYVALQVLLKPIRVKYTFSIRGVLVIFLVVKNIASFGSRTPRMGGVLFDSFSYATLGNELCYEYSV